LRITSGLMTDVSGAAALSWGEREHGAGASFFFLSFVSTTLAMVFSNDSKLLRIWDFTFSGSGGAQDFTFSAGKGV
jgi:hypothetical protein